jgi:ABC-type transporter Mla subunit MlaD
MALQDLTPQLRTRLSRMERAVGWFVLLATLLLLLGFGYYLHKTAELKGWFKVKAAYFTYADSGAGLAAGDPVLLMGSRVGQITLIRPMPAWGSQYNIYIAFEIEEEHIGYVWTEGSRVELTANGFLGKRQVEVTKGSGGYGTFLTWPIREADTGELLSLPAGEKWKLAQEVYDGTNLVSKAWKPLTPDLVQKLTALRLNKVWILENSTEVKKVTAIWDPKQHRYVDLNQTTNHLYYLPQYEEQPLSDRLQELLSKVEAALPGILSLTNQISTVLSNSAQMTANLNVVAENARPVITNLALISTQLREPGSLGQWLIPTNLNAQLDLTLQNANLTLTNANTNVAALADQLGKSLENLAGITSNLNHQVEVNTNILTQISDIVVHSDEFIQGLKRHWLLRSAFKTPKTNAPPAHTTAPLRSPKDPVR